MKRSFLIVLAMVFFMVCFEAVCVERAIGEEVRVNGKVYRLEKMVSQYYTKFNPNDKARTTNIQVARSSINGLLIKPGEIISFNELVGPRTLEAGFLEAGSYENGKKVLSVGGGICQLASTWSAATINLKLKIVERHKHSLPVSYISTEKEATVAYGFKDFRFKNTSNNILFIKCFIKDNELLYVEYWRCKEA